MRARQRQAQSRIHDQAAAARWTDAASGRWASGSHRAVVPERRRAGRVGPLRRRSGRDTHVRSEGHARRAAAVPARGARQDQVDDADRARAVEVVGELHAARRSGDLAAEPLHDHDGAQAGRAGAAVRGAQQLARHPPRRPSAAEEPGAVLPRQQHRPLGGRHAGRRVDGFDERTYIMPNGWFPQRRSCA